MFKRLKKRVRKASTAERRNNDSSTVTRPSGVVINHASTGGGAPNSVDEQLISEAPASDNEPIALPMFKDVPMREWQKLFHQKVQMCCLQIDFSDPSKMDREKGLKRSALSELVDYVKGCSGNITESDQEELVTMISFNIFRCLPPGFHESTGTEHMEPDEDKPFCDPSWEHLGIVYDILQSYVVSPDTHARIAKRFIDNSFVLKLVGLFDSEDSRERDRLKTILHRIYRKFMFYRPLIRKAITNVFFQSIHEKRRHNGLSELLEITGSIVDGLSLPMKEEHKLFLVRALIPLHKLKSVTSFHEELSNCILQFVEKDCKLADTVIKGILKYWPATNCQKEVLFLGELEEVLKLTQASEFERCMVPLFKQIARCLSSPHFQVADKALWFWNNMHILTLIGANRRVIFPIIIEAMEKNGSHWNQCVKDLTVFVKKMLSNIDMELFEECRRQYEEKNNMAEEIEEKRQLMWLRLTEAANRREGDRNDNN